MWIQELEAKTRQSQRALQQLERQASEGTSQIRNLESALLMCKEEVKTYIEALEDSKDRFDKELEYKDEKVSQS